MLPKNWNRTTVKSAKRGALECLFLACIVVGVALISKKPEVVREDLLKEYKYSRENQLVFRSPSLNANFHITKLNEGLWVLQHAKNGNTLYNGFFKTFEKAAEFLKQLFPDIVLIKL